MSLNLLRKSMALCSKHEVDVLVVVFDRASSTFQEFCSTEFHTFLESVLSARGHSSLYSTYKLTDMQSLPSDNQSISPEPIKHSRTHSPVLSDTSSLSFLTSMEKPAKLLAPKSQSKDSEVKGFLAMMKAPAPKTVPKAPAPKSFLKAPPPKTVPKAPTVSTEDTVELIPPPRKESLSPDIWQDDEEEYKYSPSDFLLDP